MIKRIVIGLLLGGFSAGLWYLIMSYIIGNPVVSEWERQDRAIHIGLSCLFVLAIAMYFDIGPKEDASDHYNEDLFDE